MKKVLKGLSVAFLIAGIAILIAAGSSKTAMAVEPHVHCICGGASETTAPAHATAENGHTAHDFTQEWEAWTSTTSLPKGTANETQYYYLTADVTIGGQVNITAGATVHLCLNGHQVGVSAASARMLIEQGNGSAAAKKLVVTNCGSKASGKLVGKFNSTQGGLIWITDNAGNEITVFNITIDATACVSTKIGGANIMVQGGGSFKAYDTDILGGVASDSAGSTYGGGSVGVTSGSVNLYGCTLTANATESLLGANISVTGGSSLTMLDTTVTGGKAKIGGNVYISGGSVTVNGDSLITGGVAQYAATSTGGKDGGHGGNIYIGGNSTFTLNGGTVTAGNRTNLYGNNVSLNGGNGKLIVNGGTFDGGITLWNSDAASVTVNGGTIGTDSEGGIHIVKGTVTVSGAPKVKKLLLDSGKTVTVGTLSDGAEVRVILASGTGTVATGLSADPSAYFDSFDGQYALSYDGGTLSLVSAAHTHCVCGGFDGTHAHDETQVWTRWTESYLPNAAGYYYLANDITLTGSRNIPDNTAVYVCLAGHTIRQGTQGSRVLQLNLTTGQTGGKKYVFTNCKKQKNGQIIGKWSGSSATQGGVLWSTGNATNEIDVYNVIVDGSLSDCSSGAAVAVESNAVFKAWNTLFIGGKTSSGGGAVSVVSGRFYAVDSEIRGGIAGGNGGSMNVGTNGHAFLTDTDIHDGQAVNGGNVRVDGEFEMTGGSIKDGISTNNGINLRVDGTAVLDGDLVISGGRATASGNSVCVCGSSGSLTINGGRYGFVQPVDSGSTVTVNGGEIDGVGFYHGTFYINGGVIGQASADGWAGHDSTGKMFITGGHFGSVKKTSSDPTELKISGGYYITAPDEAFLDTDSYLFDCNEVLDGKTYVKEVAKAYTIETQAVLSDGTASPVGSAAGGGFFRAGETAILSATAPFGADARNYRFVGWYDGAVTTELGTALKYTVDPVSSNAVYSAVYEAAATDARFTVTVDADAFTYAIDGGETATGAGTVTIPAGSELTLTYTGTAVFSGWLNESGKLVSRDVTYTAVVNADTSFKAKAADESAKTVIFYNMYYQMISSKAFDDVTDADLTAVPAMLGKTNGRWTVGGTAIATKAALESTAGDQTTVSVVAAYDDEGTTYTVTVVGKEAGTDPASIDGWTAHAAGDGVFTANLGSTAEISADAANFLYFADESGRKLSSSNEISVRFVENKTVYAVYGTTAVEETVCVTMIEASRSANTVYFEALRSLPASCTVVEQGILFTLESNLGGETAEAVLVYNFETGKAYRYVSNGKALNDVTGLTIKNVSGTVLARGYVIYSDGTKQSIEYSDIASAD